MNKEEESISAIAFNIGREIEKFIILQVGDIKHRNDILEGKIMEFRDKLSNIHNIEECFYDAKLLLMEFDKHFGITNHRKGEIENESR